jgi:hypothetical protein
MSKLSRNTERAISLITVDKSDPLLYWPAYLQGGTRLTPDGVATRNPPTEKEQLERIVEADPLGFLLALMNGQPVPVLHRNNLHDEWTTAQEGNPQTSATPSPEPPRWITRAEVANIGMRRDIAQHLLTKLVPTKSRIERDRKKPGKKDSGIFDKVMSHVSEERSSPDAKRAAPAKTDLEVGLRDGTD